MLKSAGAATGGAKITGTGKLIAQDTEIVGGTGGWTATPSGSNAQTVTIASTAVAGQATITGSTESAETALLTAGAGATITQKAGTVSNSLALATVTIDLKGDATKVGEIFIQAHTSEPAKVTLNAATAIIKTANSGSSATISTDGVLVATSVTNTIVAATSTAPTIAGTSTTGLLVSLTGNTGKFITGNTTTEGQLVGLSSVSKVATGG